ncbi:MAG: hypothetical protein BYD32DRAFT_438098 [Podila humilis]|nr:MAG: hypothetical protein BYD32DRAFT_438098 [Podila humilis]
MWSGYLEQAVVTSTSYSDDLEPKGVTDWSVRDPFTFPSFPPLVEFQGSVIRFTMKHMPMWLNKSVLAKMLMNRPQLSIEDKGTVKPLKQPSLNRKQAVFSLPKTSPPSAV